MISQSYTHMQTLIVRLCKLRYNRAVQEVKKHFVHDLGAKLHHKANREDYDEVRGGGLYNYGYTKLRR